MRKLFFLGSLLLPSFLASQGFVPGGGATGNSNVYGNIYNWGFETCHPYPAADTSNFNDGSGHSIFSTSYLSGSTPWSCDSTDAAALGNRSIRHSWTLSAGNQGYEVDYELGTAVDSIFVIQAVYYSSPFDSASGGHNFGDFVKQLRLMRPGFTGGQLAGVGPAPNGTMSAEDGVSTHWDVNTNDGYDNVSSVYEANCNRSTEPNPKTFMGGWHFFELYVNTQNDTAHVLVKVWIDGTMYWNVDWRYYPPDTIGCTPGTTPNPHWVSGGNSGGGAMIGDIYMAGTINSVTGTPTIMGLDQIEIGTNSNMTHKPTLGSNP